MKVLDRPRSGAAWPLAAAIALRMAVAPGSMRVQMVFSSTFTGTFIIHTHHGTIHGHGRAKPHGGGVKESFAGALTVTGGSGRYRHAHGIARLRGTFDRDTYALTIRTEGTLRF